RLLVFLLRPDRSGRVLLKHDLGLVISKRCISELERQDGPSAALLESSKKIRPGISVLPRMLEQARFDPEIRS
ncbi:hypothetical protein AALO_G00108860, partial [Alosa alosa]